MEPNATYDYRNYFFPGPAFPVRISMSGDPRFPFPTSLGGASMNDLTSHAFPIFPPGERIAEEVIKSDAQGQRDSSRVTEPSSPSHALVTRNRMASLPPLQVDDALQGLSRQVDKAIAFCEKCLEKHDQVVRDINSHAKKDARNSLWKGLLESRFDASDSDRDLFHNVSGRIEYCAQVVREATSAHPSARSSSHEKRREFERLVLKVKQIGVVCERIFNVARTALGDRQACEAMVNEMKTLKGLCQDVGSIEGNAGDENEHPQDGGENAAGNW